MAFAFGGTTPAASNPFGGAFGAPAATSTPAPTAAFGGFGAQPAATPAFGAASSTVGAFGSAFGGAAAATPAFGAAPAAASGGAFSFGGGAPAASTGGLFGAATPSAFGAASAPAAAAASPFNFAPATTALVPAPATGGTFGSLFTSAPAAVATPSLFGGQQQQPAGQVFTSSTKFDELPPNVQQQFTQLQDVMSQYSAQAQQVQEQLRINEAAAGTQPGVPGMQADASRLKDDLAAMATSTDSEIHAMADFRKRVVSLLKATEGVVRTFQRSKLWRDAPQQYKGQVLPAALQELLASPVVLPCPFLEQAVSGFGLNIGEYKRTLGELEQVLAAHQAVLAGADAGAGERGDLGAVLSTVVSNLHDYFIHVAARLEGLHDQVQRSKAAHLAQLRAEGDYTDPFERARKLQDYASLQAQAQQSRAQAAPPAALPAPAGGAGAPAAPGTLALTGGLMPSVAGTSAPGGGAALAAPGGSPFGTPSAFNSPFPGAAAFGAAAAGAAGGGSSLSRSGSKTGRSAKKR